jgi:hypothetical protein
MQVQERFEVDIKELPEQIDTSTYSELSCPTFVLLKIRAVSVNVTAIEIPSFEIV